ncbi:MAG: [protein-PII] uridylyltransferase [Rhizobiaceae bacterium]|nr:[protein-PII] uridylyltransferase [Rhizobiaceae bacterium]
MTKKQNQLSRLCEAEEIQHKLTALANKNSGDGSSQAVRAQVLKILKQTNANGREKAEKLLLEEGNGTRCAKRISRLQDDLTKIILKFANSHVFPAASQSDGQRIAVVAVGGYGRGTLAPGSDIDLLFLLPDKHPAQSEKLIEYILYMLWDLGFKVGHATRSVDESIRQAKEDMTIRTTILEARYLWGERSLFDELVTRFNKEVVSGTAAEFIEAKLAERDLRHKKSGATRYLVEPNVKDGKGGFRDLHTLFWIGKYYYQVTKQSELVKAGLFTKREYRKFKRAEEFLWTVRCHMHFLTGRPEERLTFDIQREMADRLNYLERGGMIGAERFMKHYFLIAKLVGDLTQIVCSQLEEQQAKSVRGINGIIRSITRKRIRKIADSSDFVNDNGRINIADKNCFIRDPVNLIRLFKLADENNLDFHPDAFQLANRSLNLIDRKIRRDPVANALFLEILTSRNRPVFLLRKMNESGVLGRFIPVFGRIVAMMQFNMYHHFTVDEHLLRTVGVLAGIESGKLAEEHPMSHELLPQMPDRISLYVAAFLHDIAKGRKEDHSIAGARIARKLCPRLGLSTAQTELVSWLILEHLTMSNTAQSRDLSDFKTIENFAGTVQSVDRLQYLLILTVCDTRAVGPGVWNGWKGQLLRTLYEETKIMLSGEFSHAGRKARVAQAMNELTAQLRDWEKSELGKILALPYDSYFLSTDLEAQIRHMGFIRDADVKGEVFAFDVHIREFEQITEITILAPDHPNLVSTIAGVCSSANANIAGAQINTLRDGRALDTFLINREFDADEDERRRANSIGKLIGDVLAGKAKPKPESSASKSLHTRRESFDVRPIVLIDNDLSNKFTVLEVEGLDRHGLLADLAEELSNLNLDIGSAQIVTFGEKAVDTFYVTDLTGAKITDKARKRKIENALIKVLSVQVDAEHETA